MFLNRAKSWLPRLSWWRGKQDFNQEEHLKEKPEVPVKCTGPPKARWWSGHRLLEIIGWGPGSAAGGGHSLFAGIPQHVAPHKPSVESPEHFQICFNFTRHLFDLCVVTLLCASSPAFRLVMDILGFGGPLKVWLHGVACFLVSAYGMYLVLWLVQEYLLQFACLYGFLQTLVLWVSIRAGSLESQEEKQAAGLDIDREEEQSAANGCKQESPL